MLLKLKAKGVVDSLLSFLLVYPATSDYATTNKVSPANALIGRKLETTHDILPRSCPKTQENPPGSQVGTLVFAPHHLPQHNRWIKGYVTRMQGGVLHQMSVRKSE